MEYLCQHCNNDINANFCSNCGQKRFKRIDKKYVYDEVQYVLIHTNKGFLYTVKNLIKNPGRTARTYVNGDRVNHYKPLLLAFVLSGISAFISFKIIHMEKFMSEIYKDQAKIMADFQSFTTSYNTFLMLALIPLFSLGSYLSFKKWGHNYFEHIVLNSYIISIWTIANIILTYPLMYIFRNNTETIPIIFTLAFLLIPIIFIWFFKEFYNQQSTKNVLGRVVLSLIINSAIYFAIIIIGVFIYFGYLMIYHPELLKQVQPK
jgi:hypothetical protein